MLLAVLVEDLVELHALAVGEDGGAKRRVGVLLVAALLPDGDAAPQAVAPDGLFVA